MELVITKRRGEPHGRLRQGSHAGVRGAEVVACRVRSLILMWSIDLEPGRIRWGIAEM
jgi:hypothetical protein